MENRFTPLDAAGPSTSADAKSDPLPVVPPRTPTPDRVKCAICLGDLVNKSYSNTCIHQFCFGCLLEWSKVKAECPLCKSTFRSIYHNIRSNADFDEYVVPVAPIPSLSIRVSSGSDRSPELFITRGNHDYSVPSLTGFGSYHLRSASAALMRAGSEHHRYRDQERILRLQLAHFVGRNRGDAIDVTLHGSRSPPYQENPFHSDAPEFFGGALDLAQSHRASQHSPMFSGYQTRRRRYDRNQWVRPFDSTLVPGTVFFPSVEYFQRHPSAIRRIAPFLHRELTVLMSLSNSRTQMAFTYELVISLALRYDIRSAEFRDLIRPYLGSKTRQFQHEFYYFVLSGMRVDEYDRIAQYPPTPRAQPPGTRSELNPLHVTPAVVTLGDTDDEAEEIIIDDDDTNNAPSDNQTSSSAVRENFSPLDERNGRHERNSPSPPPFQPFSSENSSNSFPFPMPMDLSDTVDNLDLELAIDEIDNEVSRLRGRRTRSSINRDPEMPVLEPQVDINNWSSLLSSSPDIPVRDNVPVRNTLVSDAASHLTAEDVDLSYTLNRLMQEGDELERPPRNNRRSPYHPLPLSPTISPNLLSFPYGNRPLGSPDFPILTLRENRERRNQQQRELAATTSLWEPAPLDRASCIHTGSDASSVQIRIFPPAMDLTAPAIGLNLSSRTTQNSNGRSNSVICHTRSNSSGRPTTPSANDGECEFLGVHPIVKKPPLAVITLSSEDEDDRPVIKPPVPNKTSDANVTSQPTASSSSQSLSFHLTLPPKRRYKVPPIEVDQFEAALSSLPAENLVDRHLNSTRHENQSLLKRSSSSRRKSILSKPRAKKTEEKRHKKEASSTLKKAKKNPERKVKSIQSYISSSTVFACSSLYPASSSSTSNPLDSDINLFSSDEESEEYLCRRSKKFKKKKSKKSKKSKVKTSKVGSSSKPSSTPIKSTASPPKLKSKVVKIQKSKMKSKPLISSSSESSDDNGTKSSVPRLRSVVAVPNSTATFSSTATTLGSGTGSASSRSFPTPNSALDLTTGSSLTPTPSSYILESNNSTDLRFKIISKKQSRSRRWESDDDDDDKAQNSENQGASSESGSLLSVGYDVKVHNKDQSGDDHSSDSSYTSRPRKKQRRSFDETY